MYTINIAKDFTKTPGARYRNDGPYSGEQFREEYLDRYFNDPNDNNQIIINLDGVIGYAISFLEEAFGGLARRYGKGRVKQKIHFEANEMAYYKEITIKLINEANQNM